MIRRAGRAANGYFDSNCPLRACLGNCTESQGDPVSRCSGQAKARSRPVPVCSKAKELRRVMVLLDADGGDRQVRFSEGRRTEERDLSAGSFSCGSVAAGGNAETGRWLMSARMQSDKCRRK